MLLPEAAELSRSTGGCSGLMVGPPGLGKSLLASCLPGTLPEFTPPEALEVSMVQSVAGTLEAGRISRARPFRAPHHSASMAALTGGGLKVRPGEVRLAQLGVLFLDGFPEFQHPLLDSLRQPLETGKVDVVRGNAHVTFPARVQIGTPAWLKTPVRPQFSNRNLPDVRFEAGRAAALMTASGRNANVGFSVWKACSEPNCPWKCRPHPS